MKFLQIFIFCCFLAVCLKASEVLQVSGHVGGDVSIHCSSSWTTDDSSQHKNLYFCKGVCSRENILVQTERSSRGVPQRGRYALDINRGLGIFSVTIKRLKRADAGRYCCGVEKTLNALYQEVNLEILNASTVPPGSPPPTTNLQTEAEALPKNNFPASTESPAAAFTTEKTSQRAATSLTDTTVVIIVSVSLALLVCAVIPLIFYGHWRSNGDQIRREENKGQADYCEENKDVASTQTTVRLQTLESGADPESGAQGASQYAAIYQALDPKTLD